MTSSFKTTRARDPCAAKDAGSVAAADAGNEQRGARLVERGIALVLLVLALPLIALLVLGVLILDGRPAFYGGVRLGRGKRPFRMLKLRTLEVGAQDVTGAELLGHRQDLTIPGGRFLRDTRLDELPQLWNIVRGDMNFVGPRPERPEVYAAKCVAIPGYERRFDVRPGLIGISQLFTPHGTSKRYRTLIDNSDMRRAGGMLRTFTIVAFTLWVIVGGVTRRTIRQLVLVRARRGRHAEKRRLRRMAPPGALVHFGRRTAPIVDMNEETILIECEEEPCSEVESEFVLDLRVRGNSQPAHRTARCNGSLVQRRTCDGRTHLVLRYEARSPCDEYMIQQYFLGGSLAPPRRAPPVEPVRGYRTPSMHVLPLRAPSAASAATLLAIVAPLNSDSVERPLPEQLPGREAADVAPVGSQTGV